MTEELETGGARLASGALSRFATAMHERYRPKPLAGASPLLPRSWSTAVEQSGSQEEHQGADVTVEEVPDATPPGEPPTRPRLHPEPDPETKRLWDAVNRLRRSTYVMARPHLTSVAARAIGSVAPAPAVHMNAAADEITRRYGADAVSVGAHIALRSGIHAPTDPAGAALFAHEMAHVSEHQHMSPTPETEARAIAVERRALALQKPARVGVAAAPVPSASQIASAPAATTAPTAPTVHTAESDRTVEAPVESAEPMSSAEIDHLSAVVYEQIMARLRTDFERGE